MTPVDYRNAASVCNQIADAIESGRLYEVDAQDAEGDWLRLDRLPAVIGPAARYRITYHPRTFYINVYGKQTIGNTLHEDVREADLSAGQSRTALLCLVEDPTRSVYNIGGKK